MRINKYIAQASGLSRRSADAAVAAGRVTINGQPAGAGDQAAASDDVRLDGKPLALPQEQLTIMLNKPAGYVVSRQGQGSRTVYDLLPAELHNLKPVGRLDKDSSGLLLLTSDGQLTQQLTHPSHQKQKVYDITLDKPLQPLHRQLISEQGITLDDGRSQLLLERRHDNDQDWLVRMREGRNRQIRRTFAALGYEVTALHRVELGNHRLGDLASGQWQDITA